MGALRVPLYDLVSNWAYMVIAALAWNIKSWFAMMMHRKQDRRDYIRMEFRRFLTSIILIPAMVVRRARGITIRLIGYQPSLDLKPAPNIQPEHPHKVTSNHPACPQQSHQHISTPKAAPEHDHLGCGHRHGTKRACLRASDPSEDATEGSDRCRAAARMRSTDTEDVAARASSRLSLGMLVRTRHVS